MHGLWPGPGGKAGKVPGKTVVSLTDRFLPLSSRVMTHVIETEDTLKWKNKGNRPAIARKQIYSPQFWIQKRQTISGKAVAGAQVGPKASAEGNITHTPNTLEPPPGLGSYPPSCLKAGTNLYLLRWAPHITGHMSENNIFLFKHYKQRPKHQDAHIWKIRKSWEQTEQTGLPLPLKLAQGHKLTEWEERGNWGTIESINQCLSIYLWILVFHLLSLYVSRPLSEFTSFSASLSPPFPSCQAPYQVREAGFRSNHVTTKADRPKRANTEPRKGKWKRKPDQSWNQALPACSYMFLKVS